MGNFYWTNFDEIWNHFDSVFSNWDTYVVKQKRQLSCLPSYPPGDCSLEEEGKYLKLKFAMAGFNKDKIKVHATKHNLRVIGTSCEEEGVSRIVHKGISGKDVDFNLNIDEAFDPTKAKTEFENGLLKILIPRSKDADIVELM
jgi:HSP20 family molecular chaperone IbpA